MGKPAARVGDMHTCPMVDPGPKPHVGGPVLPPGEPTVLIEGIPGARVGDQAQCVGPPDVIVTDSPTVFIGGKPAARLGDQTAHGGVIAGGAGTVIIGDGGAGPGAPTPSVTSLPHAVAGEASPEVLMKLAELEADGHGPQRHEGQVTKQQLIDRCMKGYDPMTGSETDGEYGGEHQYSRHATKVKKPEDYVMAESVIRTSPEAAVQIADAEARGSERATVCISLERIYGPDYHSKVQGYTRLGSAKHPKGVEPTDFARGYMELRLKKEDGSWKTATMFPSPRENL